MMKDKLLYLVTRAGVWMISILPFAVLRCLSFLLAFLMQHVIHYRRRTVRGNLRNAFPSRSEAELRSLESQFYRYLADYLAMEAKLMTISWKSLESRFEIQGKQRYLELTNKYGGSFLMIPHYSFFEWLIALSPALSNEVMPVQVYKPLHNKAMDRLFLEIRGRFESVSVPKHSTARFLVKNFKAGKAMAVGLITDQNPNRQEAHYWTEFLSQDTVFMDGAEKLSRMMKWPVFYADFTHSHKDFRCSVNLELITEQPSQTQDGEIMEAFARHLEATILRDPSPWFWSHKRWKNKRER